MNSKIKIQLRPIIHTKDGKIIKKYPWKNANSLIKAFAQLLMVQMSQAAQLIKNTVGTDLSVNATQYSLASNAGAGVTAYGIVIGSGTTPVTMGNYKLETQITTNVAHGAMAVSIENPDASTWRVALTRVFTNNTGGVLSIREVGLYTLAIGPGNYFCSERTLYSVDVPAGYAVTFIYRITITL